MFEESFALNSYTCRNQAELCLTIDSLPGKYLCLETDDFVDSHERISYLQLEVSLNQRC